MGAALVVIFFPLIEARYIFLAIVGLGPLAKSSVRHHTESPSGLYSNGDTELGVLPKDKFPSDEIKPAQDPEAAAPDTKVGILNGGNKAASP